LVIAGGTRSVRAWLASETPEEQSALEACAARGEWTNGRGAEAVASLRALAARLGYPVVLPEGAAAPSPAPRLVVVRRGESDLYERLTAIARDEVSVVWDRRLAERRTASRPPSVDRRRGDRRRPTPATWARLGFLLA
jgi:hypothetical protein